MFDDASQGGELTGPKYCFLIWFAGEKCGIVARGTGGAVDLRENTFSLAIQCYSQFPMKVFGVTIHHAPQMRL